MVKYSKEAIKAINSMNAKTKALIKQGIQGLCQYPQVGDIKTMQGYSDGRKRLRVGKYRVIFKNIQIGKNVEIEILIIKVGSRGDIYK